MNSQPTPTNAFERNTSDRASEFETALATFTASYSEAQRPGPKKELNRSGVFMGLWGNLRAKLLPGESHA